MKHGTTSRARSGLQLLQDQTQVVNWYFSLQVSVPQPVWEVLGVLSETCKELPPRGSKVDGSKFRVKPVTFSEAAER